MWSMKKWDVEWGMLCVNECEVRLWSAECKVQKSELEDESAKCRE